MLHIFKLFQSFRWKMAQLFLTGKKMHSLVCRKASRLKPIKVTNFKSRPAVPSGKENSVEPPRKRLEPLGSSVVSKMASSVGNEQPTKGLENEFVAEKLNNSISKSASSGR